MPITIYKLIDTEWVIECRPNPKDIIIWNNGHVVMIIQGEWPNERLEKCKRWLKDNVPEYSEDKMVRIL